MSLDTDVIVRNCYDLLIDNILCVHRTREVAARNHPYTKREHTLSITRSLIAIMIDK